MIVSWSGCSAPPLNDDALDKMVALLGRPGNVLVLHPEGTRGKGPDPYQFLPAQPGVGETSPRGAARGRWAATTPRREG